MDSEFCLKTVAAGTGRAESSDGRGVVGGGEEVRMIG